jgi:hypothetical protein
VANVGTRLIDGKLWFVASYVGPGFDGTCRPTDAGRRLVEAVEATSGATMDEQRDLGIVTHWGDEVDYNCERLLEITAPNVTALLMSGFRWDDEALVAAASPKDQQ